MARQMFSSSFSTFQMHMVSGKSHFVGLCSRYFQGIQKWLALVPVEMRGTRVLFNSLSRYSYLFFERYPNGLIYFHAGLFQTLPFLEIKISNIIVGSPKSFMVTLSFLTFYDFKNPSSK